DCFVCVKKCFRYDLLFFFAASMPAWLRWGFRVSPMTYGEIGLSIDEFLAPRWQKMLPTNETIGQKILRSRGLDFDANLFWISVAALFGFTLLFNMGFTLAISFLKHKMILPFTPLSLVFENLQYFVDTPLDFVNEVLETIELEGIRDSLVGIPGVSGLSMEQRKRLTIAVELVANPSIIFMDEPSPQQLVLLKAGGRMIYSGPLGKHSCRVIEYFGIRNNYNPATWMLEVTSASAEAELGVDFAQIYKDLPLHQSNKEIVKQLSTPPPLSANLHFLSEFSQNGWGQFKWCLWKQYWSYWRSPSYNLMRIYHALAVSLVFGILFWDQGKKIDNQQNLFNILGALYVAVTFIGIKNCASVLPYVATERTVMYREMFAGMYSPWAYAIAREQLSRHTCPEKLPFRKRGCKAETKSILLALRLIKWFREHFIKLPSKKGFLEFNPENVD
ncbi:hypothetical protein CRG98_026541, partial [Punica granatum]